jgi:O-antigen/teichoic acid export membrane protein
MFVGYKEIGYYSAIEKLITTIKQVFAMIGTVAYPHMCGLSAVNHTHVQNFAKRFFACVILLSFLTATLLCYYADYFLIYFLSINEKHVVLLLRLLSFVPLITAINLPFFLILLSYKKDKECNQVLFLGLMINAFVTLCLSWSLNSIGTCIAVLISEFFVAISLIYLLEKKNSDYSIIKVN